MTEQIHFNSMDLSLDFEIIDITPRISSRIAVFPGDTNFKLNKVIDFKEPSNFSLSQITTTLHLGAHADSPLHYVRNGESIADRKLDIYLGRVQVVDVSKIRTPDFRIYPDHFTTPIVASRILFKTHTFSNPEKWSDTFCALSPELIEYLNLQKVILVGIDTPSVDPALDQKLLTHNAIAKYNFGILEGLQLSHVSEGIYQLIALPLPIENGEASPVRAVLLKNKE